MSKFLDDANAAPLTPDLLGGAMEAIAEMSAEDRRDVTAQMIRVIRYLNDAGVGDQRAELGLAINFRIRALARLTADGGLQGFRFPGVEEGMDWLHTDVVRTAAEVPLREVDGDAAFDPVEFHEHLLKIATTAGRA